MSGATLQSLPHRAHQREHPSCRGSLLAFVQLNESSGYWKWAEWRSWEDQVNRFDSSPRKLSRVSANLLRRLCPFTVHIVKGLLWNAAALLQCWQPDTLKRWMKGSLDKALLSFLALSESEVLGKVKGPPGVQHEWSPALECSPNP